MEYVYTAMWFIIGLILIVSIAKENKIFYAAGGYFILLGTWWLLEILLDVKMFEGGPGITIKVISGAALAFFVVYFIRNYLKNNRKEKDEEKQPAENNDHKNW